MYTGMYMHSSNRRKSISKPIPLSCENIHMVQIDNIRKHLSPAPEGNLKMLPVLYAR